MMKIGFLLNIVLLLCFICSQALIWLLDGTLVTGLVQLLDHQSTVFRRNPAVGVQNTANTAPPRRTTSKAAQSYTTAAAKKPVESNVFQNGVHHHHP